MSSLLLALLLWQAQQRPVPGRQPAKPPPPKEKTILRGRVFARDLNRPLRNVHITLLPDTKRDTQRNTLTDGDGRFEFLDVDPGSYTLRAQKAGYLAAYYGQRSPHHPAARLAASGGEMKNLDLWLASGGAISGEVTGDDGEPLVKSTLYLLQRRHVAGQIQLVTVQKQETDDRGRYRFRDLVPGSYYVLGLGARWGADVLGHAPQFYANAPSALDAQRIVVTAGQEVRQITLRFATGRGLTLAGRVLDYGGQPSKTGLVGLDWRNLLLPGPFVETPVRADGRFKLQGLSPGSYRITVSGVGDQPHAVRYVELRDSVEDYIFQAVPPVSVQGRLLVFPQRQRRPIMLRSLEPYGRGGEYRSWVENASFEFTGVLPGHYRVEVPYLSPDDAYYVRVFPGSGDSILVPEGAPLSDVSVALDYTGGTVRGRLADERSDPITGVWVLLFTPDARYLRHVVPDQEGRFSIPAVIPGQYRALVWPDADPARIFDPELYLQLEKHMTAVKVEAAKAADVALALLPEVKGIAETLGR